MHLLFVTSEVFESTGGIQLWNKVFLKALSELSHEDGMTIEVISLNDSVGLRDEKYLSNDISFKATAGSKSKIVLLSLLKSTKADMVIFGHVNLAPLGLLFKIFRPTLKYGVIIYGIEVWEPLSFAKRLSVRYADFIFSISQLTADKLVELTGGSKDKIYILPNCLDPFFVDNRSASIIIPSLPKGRTLLTVSRLHPSERSKGIDHVIMAMPKVLSVFPDAYYFIVGKGDDIERLKTLSRKMGISKHVIFTGYVSPEELPGYYRSCDIFLLPSKKEGFGFVFLEAMVFEKPCIGARSGGIPEVIEDKETGMLVEYGDVEALANTIISLLGDETTSKKMGKKGHKRLMDKFTFEVYKDRLLHLMRNLRE